MKITTKFAVVLLLIGCVLLFGSALPVYAATTITVTPAAPNGWFFHDDGVAGVGVGNLVAGAGTPPLGSGSVHYVLDATARQSIATMAFAGTRFDNITALQYSTYRSSVDGGNNLAVALQFDVDYDLTDANTAWQGRLVYEPYMTHGGTVVQNTWQTWTPMTGKWWASGAPGNTSCGQATPCLWTQILATWPNAGIRKDTGITHLKAGGPAPGFEGNADALTIGVNSNDTTFNFEPGAAGLNFTPAASRVAVGSTTTVLIDLNSVTDLYGYQFQVNYDATKVSASGAFANSFFTTASPASIPTGWNAACAAGVCKFSVAHVAPQTARTGSGTLAAIVFTGVAPGTVNLTFSSNILADRNGLSIAHNAGTGTIVVYGYATITGQVNLQGRVQPGDTTGTVTLTDQAGFFANTTVNFDTTGAFTATVPAQASGTMYNALGAHSLYLSNQLIGAPPVQPGNTIALTATTLKGGDANNDGAVGLLDLTCIGGAFGGAPTVCGTTGSSDINADSTVNILDLVLAGGNYGLASPQPW